MAKQLQHNSNGGPCSRCGLRYSAKTAYTPCFLEGETREEWSARVGLIDDPKTGRFGIQQPSEPADGKS